MEKQNLEFETCFRYYEKAIEGRNEHYHNYNSWVNLYAIFTGAIFIGFYNVKENFYLQLILSLVGIITSVCWLNSVRGFYHWINSWIIVLHKYEQELNKLTSSENLFSVYNVHKNILETKHQNNLSTQKITVFFVICIVIGWNLIFSKVLLESFPKICEYFTSIKIVKFLLSFIFTTFASFIFYKVINSKNSDVKNMETKIVKQRGSKLKLCFIIDNINRFAGTEKATLDLAENLFKFYGFETVIISVSSSSSEKPLPSFIKVYHLDNNFRFFKKIKELRKSVQKILEIENPNYLISTGHNFSCLVLPKFSKILKTVAIEHISRNLVERHYRILQRLFYKKLDKVVVLTPDQENKYNFLKKENNFYKQKICCIPNSVKKIDVTNNPQKIIFAAGRFEKVKGFDILINAISFIKNELKDYEIRICGDGSLKEKLQKQINKKELQNIIKLLPNHNLKDEWEKSCLFILSSRSESFGLAVVEAASVGIPCIAFKSSGPNYIFKNTKTVLIKKNAKLLSERILKILKDKNFLQQNIKECLLSVEEFTPEKISKLWRENVFCE